MFSQNQFKTSNQVQKLFVVLKIAQEAAKEAKNIPIETIRLLKMAIKAKTQVQSLENQTGSNEREPMYKLPKFGRPMINQMPYYQNEFDMEKSMSKTFKMK